MASTAATAANLTTNPSKVANLERDDGHDNDDGDDDATRHTDRARRRDVSARDARARRVERDPRRRARGGAAETAPGNARPRPSSPRASEVGAVVASCSPAAAPSEEPLVARVSSAAPEERARADGGGDDDGDPKPATDERGRGDRAEETSTPRSRRRRRRPRRSRTISTTSTLATQERFPSLAAAAGADSLSAVAGRHQARGDAASIRVRDRGRHERHPDGPVPGAQTDGRRLSTSAFYPCARARVPTPVRSVAAAAASARRPT